MQITVIEIFEVLQPLGSPHLRVTRCRPCLKTKGSPYGSYHGFLAYTYKLTSAQLLIRVTLNFVLFFFPSVWLSLWLQKSGGHIHTCTGGLVWYCYSLNTFYGLSSL